MLNIRAAGDLTIHGSINDGFAPPPATPDDQGWYLFEWRNAQNSGNTPFGGDIVIPIDGVSLDKGTVFPKGAVLNYDLPTEGVTLPKGIALPVVVELAGNYVLPAGVVLGADVYHGDGSVAWRAGTVPTADVTLAPGMKLGAGTVLRAETLAAALTWQGRGLARADDGQRRAGAGARRLDSGHDQDRAARRQAGQPAAEDRRVPGRQLGAGADAAAGRHQLEPAADGRRRPGFGRSARRRSGVARVAGAGRLHASTRMKIVPGGVGMVYAPNDLGYPVGEPVDPDWVSDCDLLPGFA